MPTLSLRLAMGKKAWMELDISVRIKEGAEGMGIW
jgi:hypothetical protein